MPRGTIPGRLCHAFNSGRLVNDADDPALHDRTAEVPTEHDDADNYFSEELVPERG